MRRFQEGSEASRMESSNVPSGMTVIPDWCVFAMEGYKVSRHSLSGGERWMKSPGICLPVSGGR